MALRGIMDRLLQILILSTLIISSSFIHCDTHITENRNKKGLMYHSISVSVRSISIIQPILKPQVFLLHNFKDTASRDFFCLQFISVCTAIPSDHLIHGKKASAIFFKNCKDFLQFLPTALAQFFLTWLESKLFCY